MTGTSVAVQASCRRPAYRPYRTGGRKAEYGRFSVLPRPEIHRNLCIKDSVKIEPAMGSAAFLNEAVSQLAEAYLERKQKETGLSIQHDQRQQELQKVKMLIADRNVYGIDLNPTAVELAEVSLWLNTIFEGGYVPWFRTQIVNGNSLIGARRQCYTLEQAQAKGPKAWYNSAPERVEPGKKRSLKRQQVYHFLLGDPGMCAYTDKVIKGLEPEKIAAIKKWNKAFTAPLNDSEADDVLRLCAQIDALWEAHTQLRAEIKEKTTDPLSVWGQAQDAKHQRTTIRDKDRIYDSLYLSKGGSNASPYARLKAVMDYWCALWFWPIDKADELPNRMEFLWDVNMLLGVGVVDTSGRKGLFQRQISMFDDLEMDSYGRELADRYGMYGAVNLDQLRADFPRLQIANEIAEQQHFFHWELEFSDVFEEHGGFDLVVGNPPWIRLEWNEEAVLGDREPRLAVKKFTATQTTKIREELLNDPATHALYFVEYESMTGQQVFLNALMNYPLLKGQQTNLFKCFLPQAWAFSGKAGVSAFVHPDGVYDDPKGGILRAVLYPKLRKHFQFTNELKLFEGVDHHTGFSLNIYCNSPSRTFETIGNLFAVETIDQCYDGNSKGPVPGIKDEKGWCTQGNPDRVIRVGERELKLFAKLFDGTEEWRQARLPVLHAQQLVDFLEHFGDYKPKIDSLGDDVFFTKMHDETNSQKAGTISRNIHFPKTMESLIYSGPHIGFGNPLFKTSRSICEFNSDYDPIDLTSISESYWQRCNYIPECNLNTYYSRIPKTTWGVSDLSGYRIAMREMANLSGEHTLYAAIIPKGAAHLNTIFSAFFKDSKTLAAMAGSYASLPFDGYIKVVGRGHVDTSANRAFPLFSYDNHHSIALRGLLLNCLTIQYAELWNLCYDTSYLRDSWSKDDPRVEIDVLTAMALGMTLDQLKTIYRIQFPVLQQYEADTWYDANGRIVFTTNRGLTGVGFDRKEWENGTKGAPAGKKFYRTITDDTQPGGPVQRTIEYVAPFDRCDREKDYETAWRFFEEKCR